jgi:hypothetical protein
LEKEIRRENYQYIEEFEEYEFTTCIVYEMYKRKSGLNIDDLNITENFFIKSNYKVSGVLLYKKGNEIYTLQEEIYSIYPQLLSVAKKEISKLYKHTKNINMTDVLHEYSLDLKFVIENYINNENEIFNVITYFDKRKNIYIQLTKELLKDLIRNSYINNVINPKFKNPILDYNRGDDFVSLNLNLALPENELLAYIKKLKNINLELSTNSSILNILGGVSPQVVDVNNIYKFKYKNEKGKNKGNMEEIDTKDILTFNGKKNLFCADMFYIYDAYKLEKSKEDIEYELKEYHNKKNYDPKVIKKLERIGIEYIDKEKFYELYHSFYP